MPLEALSSWMDQAGIGAGPITNPRLLAGGTQHVMIGFDRGPQRYVFRQAGEAGGADARIMQREIRVLTALAGTDVPHARLIAAAPDGADDVGPTFYLGEFVEGVNLMVRGLEAGSEDRDVTEAMAFGMAQALATLTSVAVDTGPLDGFGKPDGFLERQASRWFGALEAHARTPAWDGVTPAEITGLVDWLERNLPTATAPSLIHGDYQIANVMFHPRLGTPTAIVDWEMATIGDPRLDLGWMLSVWPEAETEGDLFDSAFGARPFLPSAAQVVEVYRSHSGLDLSALVWFRVLAALKFAVVLEGGYAAALRAGRVPPEVARLHRYARALADRALRWQAQEEDQ